MTEVIGRAKVIVESDVNPTAAATAGTRMGNLLGSALKRTAIGAGAAVGAVLGTAIAKGFSRLTAIEEAEAKLKGLGNSAKTVTTVMENSLAAVKGTAFGLGDAASIAASAVAAGVKPGKELERTLRLVGDAATIGGTSLGEMGAIFNKVAATGKAQGEVLQQLGERGIPILQLLSKSLGVNVEKVLDLSKEGKISFADFQKAIEEGMGGAALKSGETFRGALANAGAALGRFGAALLGPTFKDGPGVFSRITEKLDDLTPAAENVGKKIGAIGDAISKLQKSKDWKQLVSDMKKFGKDLGTVASALTSVVGAMNKLTKESTGAGLLHWLVKIEEFIGPLRTLVKLLDAAVEAWKFLKSLKGGDDDSGSPNSSWAGPLIDAAASGGPVRGLTLVGENGPELANFGGSGGYVYNNSQTREMLAGASGATVNNTFVLNGPNSLAEARSRADWSTKYGTRFGAATQAGGL